MNAYEMFKRDLFRLFLAWLFITLAMHYWRIGFDATDDVDAGRRSGVALRIDHGTGCQYIEGQGGGITPRLDRDGRHICAHSP